MAAVEVASSTAMARAPIGGRTWQQRNLLPSPSSIASPLSCASGLAVSSFLHLSSPRQLRQVTLTPYPSPLKHSKTPAQTPPPSPGFAGRDRHHRRVVSSPVRPFIHLSLAPSEAFPGSQRPRGPQAATAVACSSAPPLRLRWPLPSSSLVFASSAPSFFG
ncbi:uncharacterized protein LOC110266909 [Arachis ipaensis]|uniref:uncharacterized protein LOC110266909 n=1 Tax=Arachis ipaensis TaxID=130454 RepID=UPI000A2B7717|nr:uncharacterized protein LOC110266909 [Arachis ipaensis]